MKQNLSKVLDECLTLLEADQATLEECLGRYPGYAAELRPLLEIAFEVRSVPPPASSTVAFAAGKQRMLQALTTRASQRVVPLSPLRIAAIFVKEERSVSQRRVFIFQAALVTVAVLVLSVVVGLSFLSWPRGSVFQTATLAQVNGAVEIMPAGGDTWQPALAGKQVEAGDRVRTGLLSAATLIFFDGSTTALKAETEIAVVQTSSQRDGIGKVMILRQTSGQTYNHVQRLPNRVSRFEIETPTAATAVRGTEFTLTVEADGATHVAVVEGVVNVTAQGITVAVLTGQEATVRPEQLPALAYPTPTATPTPQPTPTSPYLLQETSSPEHTPTPTETPQPPGQTKTPQPPGLTKTPQPPGQTKVPTKPTKAP